jgi:hypothetical protein
MYNLLIALAVGLAVAVAVLLAHLPWYAAVVPGFLAFAGAFLLLARRVGQKVKAIMDQAQKELSVQPTSQRERQQRIDKAVKTLESALPWEKWQPFIGGEIHAQIGMVQYMVKDYLQAEPHLRQAGPRNGLARACSTERIHREGPGVRCADVAACVWLCLDADNLGEVRCL